jgi:hypothetical protein
MADEARLYDLAKVLRSKNAGPFELTLDIMFDDEAKYRLVKESGVINRDLICRLYGIPAEEVYQLVCFDAALGIKITIRRPTDSGSIGDTDVYGAQQHAPLMDVVIPLGNRSGG